MCDTVPHFIIMANLKIAIVGGGIGGIATAIGLVRQGFEAFDVFEGAVSGGRGYQLLIS